MVVWTTVLADIFWRKMHEAYHLKKKKKHTKLAADNKIWDFKRKLNFRTLESTTVNMTDS